MKYSFLVIFILVVVSCKLKTDKEIKTQIDYIPEQRAEVSDQDYRKWTSALANTYEQIKSDSGNIVYADHLNIATALIKLKEPKQKVLVQFFLAQEKDLESTAEVFPLIYSSPESVSGYLSESEYDSILEKFTKVMENKKELKVDLTEYSNNNSLDIEIVKLMASLQEKDQKFRMSDIDHQQIIDIQNINAIDSLFNVHGKYIGRSFVGEQYQNSMWAIIQHSDLEHQEKYLPVVHKAVSEGELPSTPLKLLIDRVYKKKYGYQIFGSQAGGDLADDETIERVKKEYGF